MYVFIHLPFGEHPCKNTVIKSLTFNTHRTRNIKLTSGIIQYKSYLLWILIHMIDNNIISQIEKLNFNMTKKNTFTCFYILSLLIA